MSEPRDPEQVVGMHIGRTTNDVKCEHSSKPDNRATGRNRRCQNTNARRTSEPASDAKPPRWETNVCLTAQQVAALEAATPWPCNVMVHLARGPGCAPPNWRVCRSAMSSGRVAQPLAQRGPRPVALVAPPLQHLRNRLRLRVQQRQQY
jgi:hypothetical protein